MNPRRVSAPCGNDRVVKRRRVAAIDDPAVRRQGVRIKRIGELPDIPTRTEGGREFRRWVACKLVAQRDRRLAIRRQQAAPDDCEVTQVGFGTLGEGSRLPFGEENGLGQPIEDLLRLWFAVASKRPGEFRRFADNDVRRIGADVGSVVALRSSRSRLVGRTDERRDSPTSDGCIRR